MRDNGKGRAGRPLIQEVWVAQMRGDGPREALMNPHVFAVPRVDKA
jgi:hypothetical protein